jgi:hypothetical protein
MQGRRFAECFVVFPCQEEEPEMQFLRRIVDSNSSEPQAPLARAASRSRRPRIELEALEGRDLLSIAGITLQYGNLAITAPKSSGNVAQVWIDPSTHNLAVSLNGQSEQFAASTVSNITYKGGASGGDTFVNSTSLTTLAWGYGGKNQFSGGTGYNYVYFFGNNNTFTAQGGVSDVWENKGTGDVIVNPNHYSVTVY